MNSRPSIVDVDAAVRQDAVDIAGEKAHAPCARDSSSALGIRSHRGAEQVVHVQRAGQRAARRRPRRAASPWAASPSASTQSAARRSASMVRGVARHEVRDAALHQVAALTQAAAQIAVGEDSRDTRPHRRSTIVMPMPLLLISTIASASVAVCGTRGTASPVRMTSRTRVSSRRPSAPPGCERAKSSTENPRASSSASASASPSASAAVVLAVGARPSGHASASTARRDARRPTARASSARCRSSRSASRPGA